MIITKGRPSGRPFVFNGHVLKGAGSMTSQRLLAQG